MIRIGTVVRGGRGWAGVLLAGVLACAGAGCAGPARAGGVPAGRTPANEPFAPATIRVHALTHTESAGAPDKAMIILHYELRDRYGDVVKSIGKMRVQLYKPGPETSVERQELAWDVVELADADENARRFDRATRTYRIPLMAPAWVHGWKGPAGTGLKLRVVYTAIGADAGERYLEDEYVMP